MASLAAVLGAAAAPCTLYQPEDLANARENLRRHAWAQALLADWTRRAEAVLARDRAFFEAFIPDLTPWTPYGNNCPACVGKQSSMGEIGLYRWSVDRPEELLCKYCGTVYPNPLYPETGRLVCARMGQEFTYYETDAERAHPEDRSGRHAFRWASWPVHTSWSGLIRYHKAHWCIAQVPLLARLYALTGKPVYAERCIWIMDRLARVYPNWLYHSYNGTFADCPPADAAREMGTHPRAGRFPREVIVNPCGLHQEKDYAYLNAGFWGAGRFGTGSEECSMLLDMAVAYDLVRDAAREDGTRLLDADVEERIVRDLILAGCADRENWAEINNKAGPNRALSVAVGRLFGRPESVRRGLEGLERLLEECFHPDGFCRESPGYSGMHLSLMADIPLVLRGYSDPPGYTPPDGRRLDAFDPFRHLPRYRLALESMLRMTAPDRRPPVLGDTHRSSGLSTAHAEVLTYWYDRRYAPLLQNVLGAPLAERGGEYALWYRPADLTAEGEAPLPLHSEWFPGWHVGVLRGRDPHGPLALYLNGYESHGHRHADTLGIVLYAFRRELASDRGYIWDDPRNAWTSSTLAHNLVAVDDQDQIRAGRRSALRLFAATPLAQAVEADANAYAQCDLYRRACVLVPLGDETGYVLDIFRVRGGRRHSYGLQCNGTLAAVEGADLAPLDREHRWLRGFRSGPAPAGLRATWLDGDISTCLTTLCEADRAVVADAPGWRSSKGTEMNAPPIQQLFLEREAAGDGPLESLFVTVLAPGRGANPAETIRRLPVTAGDGVAVEVAHALGRDVLLFSFDDRGCSAGEVVLQGRAGLARYRGGEPVAMALLDGASLTAGARTLRAEGSADAVAVTGVEGCSFLLEHEPPRGWSPGACLLAGDTGYEVAGVEGRRVSVRDYPAMPCDRVRLMPAAVWLSEGYR